MGLRDGWLFKPNGYQSGVPSTRGRLTPAEFFEIAGNLYDAARLDSARKSDETALQRELREALNRTTAAPRDVADERVKGTARIRPDLPKESEVERADFRNFTYELGSTACGDAVQKITGSRTVKLRDGRYVAARSELLPDFHVAVAEKVAAYHDVDGDGRKEAVVMLFCGHALRSWVLPVVFRLEGGRPSIVAYLEESHRALGGPAEANVEMSGADLLVSFQWNKRLFSDAYREMGVYRWVDGTLKRVH
jgi:hypothetical protein